MIDPRNVTGVVLVGGKSSRMGRDKATLPIDGEPLVNKVLAALRTCLPDLILIGNRPERFDKYELPIFPDIHPGSALGGLHTGLSRAKTPYIFASACDLPFASPHILRYLISVGDGFDATVPLSGEHPEPLFSLYHKNCLDPMEQLLKAGNYRIRDLFPLVRTRFVPEAEFAGTGEGERPFLNINTVDEYEAIRKGEIS